MFNQQNKTTFNDLYNNEYIGIENDGSDEMILDKPYDPDKISIETRKLSVETIIRRSRQEALILDPDFQRNDVWDITRKSRLIESIILKLPLPMFYFSADKDGKFAVIDGKQRLSSIINFIREDLDNYALYGLEFCTYFEGMKFSELPYNIKNRIYETEIYVTIVNPGTPESLKRNIFKRINTGGMPLSPQEIRNALYTGTSTTLLSDLSATEDFRKATDYSIRQERMEDKELILRFLAFYIRDYNHYKTTNIDTWLSDTMLAINYIGNDANCSYDEIFSENKFDVDLLKSFSIKSIKKDFSTAMQRCHTIFGENAFRKSIAYNIAEGRHRTPINKSLFEVFSYLLLRLTEKEFEKLTEMKSTFIEKLSVLSDPEFERAISRDSMKAVSVNLRFEKVKVILEGILKND